MINRLLDAALRTDRGDGPVPRRWAETYAEGVWAQRPELETLESIERRLGGLRGKRVLDLGAGPAFQSVYFARRGAQVVWHDVSRAYLEIAARKAQEAGVHMVFSLGYLEDAARLGVGGFDLVYNRGCWFYCRNDAPFARLLVRLLKPRGLGYVDTHNDRRGRGEPRPWYHAAYRLGVKVGHPFPPHRRVERLLAGAGACILETDYSEPLNDRVTFTVGKAP